MIGESEAASGTSDVALIDNATYRLLVHCSTGALHPNPALMGLNSAAALVREAAATAQVHVLCRHGWAEDALSALEAISRQYPLGIDVPKVTDDRCIVLPDTRESIAAVLRRYHRIIVLGTDAIVVYVAPAGEPVPA